MDVALIQGFVEEAESYFPEIREGIFAYARDLNNLSSLQNSIKKIATIRGAGSMIGLPEIADLAKELESGLGAVVSAKSTLDEDQTQAFLEQLEQIGGFLAMAKSAVEGQDSDVLEFDDADFSQFEEESAANDSSPADGFDDFDADPEMLEVFAMEAEDLLRNIGTHLTSLEKHPNKRESLLEIRRSAHTLKGSAGIVGFKQLSELAHRVEDLLDYLSDNHIDGDSAIFEILLASTDALEELIVGKKTPELDEKLSELYTRFDDVMATLQAPVTAAVPAESQVSAVSEIALAAPDAVMTDIPEEAVQEADLPAKLTTRVSLERLDLLARLTNEMVITRSVFEQRLMELEQQIQELQHTTNRLRRSTSKLELDFEASTLGRQNYAVSSFGTNLKTTNPFSTISENEFDTLEFDQYTEFHQTTRELIESATDTYAINSDLDALLTNLNLLFDGQRHLIDEMQDNLMRLRMVPLNSLSARLHRTIRVTANEEEKQAELEINNNDIEVETQILDVFTEPLLHLLRNAVAHGIEAPETRLLLGKPATGKITLKVYSEGTHIVFTVSDDGRGISANSLKDKAYNLGFITDRELEEMTDEDAYSLIFLPGLSTSTEINQVSGRGVGMNVVKSCITKRHGTISIKSAPQKGTTFTVRLPMSLAVTRALLVKADGQLFAFPLKLVKQVTEIAYSEVEKAGLDKTLKVDSAKYTLMHFNELLNLPVIPKKHDVNVPLLLLETSERPCALIVDQIIKPEEVVIKSLGHLFSDRGEILGATILGDGSVVPVLDLVYLLKSKPAKPRKTKAARAKAKAQLKIMIVDDSPSVRQVNSNIIKNAGWLPIVAKDGIEALELLQESSEPPDIILTDVEMPRMDGYELLASVRRQEALSEIPVFMITSRTGEKHRRKAYDLGVTEYITKPYEDTVLVEKMKNLIETH